MTATLTSRHTTPNTSVLARLAERWRPAGLYLACLGRDGELAWHDSHMPRLFALTLTDDATIAHRARAHADACPETPLVFPAPFGGIQVALLPVHRRRKVLNWLVVLARTDAATATEALARAAQRARVDVQAVLAQTQRAPLVPASHLPALAALVDEMSGDMNAVSAFQGEISSVTEQLTSVYEEISLLYKISSGMRFSQKAETFLQTVCREVQEIGNFRTVGVLMTGVDEDAKAQAANTGMVVVGHQPVPSDQLADGLKRWLLEALATGETQVVNEITADAVPPALRAAIERVVCVPLVRDRRPLGVLIAVDKHDHSEFNSVDLKLLNNVGNQCSIFLENAALYQDMQGLFMGVLHALTRSIDAKDAYTRGHSQRVAELSRTLARKVGLPEEQCERVYLSGLLHDVGKIGVPESVLTKPGRLTDAEFDAIKKHPEIGAQILGNIKQLQDILPGVLYHHERWDGRGYPYNLAGENIPLIGRIICVADSFDAMSSTRTYRPALPLDTVLAEIARCAGAQFDPQLAKLFITLDFNPYRQAVEEQMAGIKPKTAEAAP